MLCRKGLEQARSGWRRLAFPLLKLFLLNSTDLESDDAFALFCLQGLINALECQSRAGAVRYSRVELLDEFLAEGATFVGLILS